MYFNSQGESYIETTGGLFMLGSLLNFSKTIKGTVYKRFPALSEFIYKNSSTEYFTWAIILLILTATLVAVGLEHFGKLTAVIVFYFLSLGVLSGIRLCSSKT